MSQLTEFDIGDTATITASFTVSNTATDPTTVSLTVTDPSGNAVTYTYADSEITKSSTGSYTKSVAVDEAGEWIAVYAGTGTVVATGSQRFSVRRSGA